MKLAIILIPTNPSKMKELVISACRLCTLPWNMISVISSGKIRMMIAAKSGQYLNQDVIANINIAIINPIIILDIEDKVNKV